MTDGKREIKGAIKQIHGIQINQYVHEGVEPVPNKENLRLWVAELRREDVSYKQARQRMGFSSFAGYEADGTTEKRVPHYCCLAVACEVARTAGAGIDFHVGGKDDYFEYGADRSMSVLPKEGTAWLGISEGDQAVTVSEITQHVIDPDDADDDDEDADSADDEDIITKERAKGVRFHGLTASELNDHAKLTFKQIADIIEWRFALVEEPA